MKKQLMTTTALVAAGLLTATGAAQAQKKGKKPFITVNGYHEQVIGANFGQDDHIPDTSVIDTNTESEIHFNGHATLDNGIKLRAHWELEGSTQSGGGADTIDEAYMIIRGSFGQLTLGSEDNAGHLMTIGYSGSWATGVGQNLTFDSTDFIVVPGSFDKDFNGTLNDVRLRSGDNDSEKITYYTPRVGGAQLGFSYIPNFQQDSQSTPATTTGFYHDGIAFGANFTQKFGSIGVGVAAGFLTAAAPAGTTLDRMRAYNVAARLDFGPFRVAGAFKENIDLVGRSGGDPTESNSGQIWDVGARYRMGANSFSLTFARGEGDATFAQAGQDVLKHGMLSYARALGPGVKWTANLIYADMDGEDPGNSDDNTGYAVTSSLRMNF